MKATLKRLYMLNRKSKRRKRMTPAEFRELGALLDVARDALGKVTDDYVRLALTERYINAKSWRSVTSALGAVSDDSIRRACARAVGRYM